MLVFVNQIKSTRSKKKIEKFESRIISKSIWTLRKYFIDKYGVDTPVINGDQMPLHRNESASQETLSLKSKEVFVKETTFGPKTELKAELKPKFVFKGKGTRTHVTPPKGVHYQWAPKGSYRIEQILCVID